jgi:hypothetical protein
MEAPPLIPSEICLNPEFASTRCCGISRTSIFRPLPCVVCSLFPPAFSGPPVLDLPASSLPLALRWAERFPPSFAARTWLVTMSSSPPVTPRILSSQTMSSFTFCNAQLLTDPLFEQVYNIICAFPRLRTWLPTLRNRPNWIDTSSYMWLRHATNMACTSRKTQQR